jgi:hypothetical protein
MWVYGHRGNWVPGIEEKIVSEVVRQIGILRGKGAHQFLNERSE